jgi:hypothetical protein
MYLGIVVAKLSDYGMKRCAHGKIVVPELNEHCDTPAEETCEWVRRGGSDGH